MESCVNFCDFTLMLHAAEDSKVPLESTPYCGTLRKTVRIVWLPMISVLGDLVLT